MIKKSVHNNQ